VEKTRVNVMVRPHRKVAVLETSDATDLPHVIRMKFFNRIHWDHVMTSPILFVKVGLTVVEVAEGEEEVVHLEAKENLIDAVVVIEGQNSLN